MAEGREMKQTLILLEEQKQAEEKRTAQKLRKVEELLRRKSDEDALLSRTATWKQECKRKKENTPTSPWLTAKSGARAIRTEQRR